MPTYQFRCPDDGVFEVTAAMGAAGRWRACPRCEREGVRVFTAPMLARADRRVVAALDAADRSREQPEVVHALPNATPASGRRKPARRAPPDPALRRLPRP